MSHPAAQPAAVPDANLPPAPAGPWLYRDGAVLIGPVSGDELATRLYRGEVLPETPVGDEEGLEWRPLEAWPGFEVHLARARAAARVRAEQEAVRRVARRRARRRALLLGVVTSLLVVGVGAGTWWVITHRALEETPDALADLGITVSPPVIALAGDRPAAEGGAWLEVDTSAPAPEEAPAAAAPRPRRRTRATATRRPAAPAPTTSSPGPDGLTLERSYDMDHIKSVVEAKKTGLYRCIKEEVRRSGFKGEIPFEFVIRNDGRVGRLWIDARLLRDGPLEACFKAEMATWRFRSFQGEQPTYRQSFRVGR